MPYSSLYTQAKNSKKDFITNLAKPTMVADPLTANITNKFGTSPASPSATSPVRANPAKQQFIQSQATQPAGFNQNAQMQTQGFDSAPQGTQTPPTPQTPAVDPNKGYKEAFQAYIQSLTPTSDETSATENLNRVSTQNRLDYEKALQSGETLGYATGLAGEQARTAAIQEAGLSGRVSALTGQRQAMTEAQKARMEFEKSLIPKADEGFTLGEGQVRYDAQGNRIAEGAPKNLSISEQYGTGSIGEYNLAKSQGYKGSFSDYQNEDANRKKSIARAGVAGLTPYQESSVFNSIVGKYNASPLIQAADRTPVLKDSIANIRKDPKNAAQQLNLSYAYIQALDTYQSAVREGELSLVNSIDSKVGQLSNYVSQIQNGQIVRPEVALQIANAAENLVNTINSAAKQKAKSFQSQADVSGVGSQFGKFTGGFTPSYDQSNSTQQPFTAPDGTQVIFTD